jgi:nucleoid-associated protein YgaU
VKAGESLGSIAKKVYGDEKKWRTIFDANRSLLTAPTSLRAGMKLSVP